MIIKKGEGVDRIDDRDETDDGFVINDNTDDGFVISDNTDDGFVIADDTDDHLNLRIEAPYVRECKNHDYVVLIVVTAANHSIIGN